MITKERLLPGPAAIERVTGHRPHYSQFFRWTEQGLKTPDGSRVRLEFAKCGRKRLTSIEAVRRLFAAQTEAANRSRLSEAGPSTNDQDATVERDLQIEGI